VSQPRYGYIDALRGYAILGVIGLHTSQNVANVPVTLKVTTSGQYGVQLFFVVSALALLLSWHARNDGATRFYVRRLFRIAPMFWLAACVCLVVYGMAPRYWAPDGVTALKIIATFAFLNGWSPDTMNALVPGGWSISAEVMFYILFPFLAASVTSLSAAVVTFLTSLAIAILGDDLLARLLPMGGEYDYLTSSFREWWFVAQIPVFIVGFMVYHALRVELPRWAWSLGVQISTVTLLFLVFVTWLPGPRQVLFALAFGLLALSLAKGAGGWIVNPIIVYIGRVSYSAYFWHFAILANYDSIGHPLSIIAHSLVIQLAVLFVIVVLISVAVSTITYALIEKPMIQFGSRFVSRCFQPCEAEVRMAPRVGANSASSAKPVTVTAMASAERERLSD